MIERLVVFDVDGTLIQSAEFDERCWCRAVEEVFGFGPISTDWGSYEHSTDRGILDELLRTHRGHSLNDSHERPMLDRFVALLAEELARDPAQCIATAGACEALAALPHRGWRVAIGTGGWQRSARLKLAWAGIDVSALPIAYAEDGPTRERIIRTAVARAIACARGDGSSAADTSLVQVVYVGDGRWDAVAAANVGAGFVGIGGAAVGDRGESLRQFGVRTVLPDLADLDLLVRALDESRPATITLADESR